MNLTFLSEKAIKEIKNNKSKVLVLSENMLSNQDEISNDDLMSSFDLIPERKKITENFYVNNDIKVLCLYASNSLFTQTVEEHITSFKNYLPFDVYYAHSVLIENDISFLDDFDVIIIHYSCGLYHPTYFSKKIKEKLNKLDCLKIVFAQDEYDNTNLLVENINYIKANLYYTCVPESLHKKIFKNINKDVKIISNYTGYIYGEYFYSQADIQNKDIIFSYKTRPLHPKYGTLGYNKVYIANFFKKYCLDKSISHVISSSEEERFYWNDWSNLLRRTKSMACSASGSRVFDFDGSIKKSIDQKYGLETFSKYEKFVENFNVYKNIVKKLEIIEEPYKDMDQISPRFFEMMIHSTIPLVYGNFLPNDFKPYENFIPFDFNEKNLDDVFAMVNDETYQKKIVTNNIEYLRSGKNNYKSFIRLVEFEIRKNLKNKNTRKFFSNIYRSIPRVQWVVHPNDKKYNSIVWDAFRYINQNKKQIYDYINPLYSPTSEPLYHLEIECNNHKNLLDANFEATSLKKNEIAYEELKGNAKNVSIGFFEFKKNITLIKLCGHEAKRHNCSKIFYFFYSIYKLVFPKPIKKIVRRLFL